MTPAAADLLMLGGLVVAGVVLYVFVVWAVCRRLARMSSYYPVVDEDEHDLDYARRWLDLEAEVVAHGDADVVDLELERARRDERRYSARA